MEGIKGLELISTQIDSMRIEHIGIVLIIPILFFITSIAIIIRGVRDKDIKDRMSIVVTGLLLMAMTLIMGTMFTKAFCKNKEDIKNENVDKIHKFKIVDKKYHVDLGKYKLIEINEDEITLLEEK